jgi:hypothetical protein
MPIMMEVSLFKLIKVEAQFNITCDEFQAMFDWAKAQGFVK